MSENPKSLNKRIQNKPILRIIVIISLCTSIGLIFLVFLPLTLDFPRYSILHFQYALTISKVAQIFDVWGAEGIFRHTLGVYWDFLFILSYTIFLSGYTILSLQRTIDLDSKKSEKMTRTKTLMMIFSPVAMGVFDILENLLLFVLLTKNLLNISDGIPICAAIFASIKFLLFFITIGFIITIKKNTKVNRKKNKSM